MPNDYFEFKQFKVEQQNCAMKIGADSVLFGAWARVQNNGVVLDVGTGTGILSLMMAQKYPCIVHAIDIDEGAVQQAKRNFTESPWAERLKVEKCALQEYVNITQTRYDLILSNPPYFSEGVESSDTARAVARHTSRLKLEELVACSKLLLKRGGKIALILPVSERKKLIAALGKNQLWLDEEVKVSPNANKPINRLMFLISTEVNKNRKVWEMSIEMNKRKEYSQKFIALTKGFYKNMK